MFQLASLIGISRNRGFEFCIAPQRYAGSTDINVKQSDGNVYSIFDLSNLRQEITTYPTRVESTFNFDKSLFDTCSDNTDLIGYFQNEKYFKNVESEIRELFSFSDQTMNLCKQYLTEPEYVSLHIRRGDYVKNPNHPVQPINYYEKALTYFDQDIPVIVFSDDYKWCQRQQMFQQNRFLISENNTTEIDLCLQTLCSYHIICNSSYSWWGSYLANSKMTVAPKLWFGETLDKDSSDIYRKEWKVI